MNSTRSGSLARLLGPHDGKEDLVRGRRGRHVKASGRSVEKGRKMGKLGDFMGKWDDSGILVGFHGKTMGKLWDFSGMFMGCEWDLNGKMMGK